MTFTFCSKSNISLQPAPPQVAGNQLSLVNETNVDSITFIYINFIYRVCSTQLLEDVVFRYRGFNPTFSTFKIMLHQGPRSGSSLSNDERPILSAFWDSRLEFETWVTGLNDYVNTMRELYPGEDHPGADWLAKGFAMISLGQGREVTTESLQGVSGIGGQVPAVGEASASPRSLSAMQRNLDVATSRVASLGLSSRPAHSSQRVKDRLFRVQSFSNKAAQFHAADLFDVQTSTLDLAKTVEGYAPYLTLTACPTPSADSSEAGASVVTSPSTVGDILSPLITKIGRLHCLVDNRVHLQQSASMSSVGYNAYYTHKNSLNQGPKN